VGFAKISSVAPLFDAHNHLQDAWLAPHRDRIVVDLAAAGIARGVVNGTCETDWPEVAALAKSYPVVLSSYGLHPWDTGNRTPDWQRKILAHLDADPRAAVGEIGLDRWILDRARSDDPRLAGLRRAPLAEQMEVFTWQLALAAERNLPASIHCLDAFGPLLDTLRASRLPARGFLLHAYSGSAEMAKHFADLGANFSFNGAFLDPRKTRLREIHVTLPADRILVETDAPAMRLPAALEKYSLPAASDGALPNHPANLAATYGALAELRGVTLESLTAQVQENFVRLFGN
jgi:TatD DNase family protein